MTGPGFVWGDIEPADVYDPTTAGPAPEQVAGRLYRLMWEIQLLAGHKLPRRFALLAPVLRAEFDAAGVAVVEYLSDHHAPSAVELAQAVHDERRRLDPLLPMWTELTGPERELAIDLMDLILTWLTREGSI